MLLIKQFARLSNENITHGIVGRIMQRVFSDIFFNQYSSWVLKEKLFLYA